MSLTVRKGGKYIYRVVSELPVIGTGTFGPPRTNG